MRFLYSTANIFCLLFLWRQMQQHTVCYLMNACHSAFWLSCLAAATNTNTKDDVLCSVDYSCTTACHRPLFATAQGDDRPPWPFTVGFVVQQKLSKFATVTLLEGSFWISTQAVELKSIWLCFALWFIGNTSLSRIAHSLGNMWGDSKKNLAHIHLSLKAWEVARYSKFNPFFLSNWL